MSNYCACSGGDEEYTIELNQQGPEGPRGPVGPEGFSPSISVKTNTDKAYVLTVVNKEGTFDTPNLYGEIEKLNADLSNIPNPAFINGIALSRSNEGIPSIEIDGSRITTGINGNLMLSANSENEEGTESFNYKVVANPKEQRLELHDNEGNVKIVATTDYIPTINVATTTTAGIVKPDGNTITVSTDGTISAVQQDLSNLATKEELASTDATVASIQTSLDSKLESSNIIAGTNVTIDRNGNNLTINSIGGGGGSGAAIDDSSISSASTWSSSKINSEITTVAETKNDNIFDIGKFTLAGNPTITDDGIVTNTTGYSGNCPYVQIPALGDNWEIVVPFNWENQSSIGVDTFFRSVLPAYNIFSLGTNGVQIYLWLQDINKSNIFTGYLNIQNLTNLLIKITCKKEADSYSISVLSSNDTGKTWTTNKTLTGAVAPYICQNELTYQAFIPTKINAAATIDLKQFSITVDGVNIFNGLMESTKPIYDRLFSTSTALSTFETETDNNFSAVNSALNEKANLSDLAGYVPLTKYNELLARVVALETEINGGNA